MTAQAAPEAEEVRTPVTQVVEIVEVEEEKIPEAAEPAHEAPVEPPAAEEPPLSEPQKEAPQEDSTRKSMVEELYSPERTSRVMPEISMHKNKPIVSLFVWAVVTILVAIVTGGILFAAARKTSPIKLFARPTQTPTASPTSAPTPTPATVDKTSFDIQVLNGGGAAGAAGKMKTFLEGKGYKVAGTGNTDAYTYTTTEIHGKATMKDAIANLQADLKDTYTLGTVAADLSASASADVQVIVGK